METLFRWSKFIRPEEETEWETKLLMGEVSFHVETSAHRQRALLTSYCSTRTEAEELRRRFGGAVNEVRPEDWMPRDDPSSARLLKIRDRFIVAETGDEVWLDQLRREQPEREILSFPPQLAFGTGAHATTANCLRLLVDAVAELPGERARDWTCLDLGCGSGILSVAAIKLGARRATAVEIDPLALGFAEENGRRHQASGRIEFVAADALEWLRQSPAEPYDIIAANLFSELLIQVFPLLKRWLRPGGRLIVSGFLASQDQDLRKKAARHGFQFGPGMRRGKWVAVSGVSGV